MEGLKKQRTVLRRLYTESEKKLRRAIEDKSDTVSAAYGVCKERAEALARIDEQVTSQWFLEASASEDEICADLQTGDVYKLSWLEVCSLFEKTHIVPASSLEGDTIRSNVTLDQHRRFQLPRIELRKFDGSVKNWISFWGQFEKIHKDTSIDAVDKFQYLIQATIENSKARALVESYPPSAENYMKAVTELKERFARDDLLVEYYIRSLLHLVLSNRDGCASLRELYDKLSTQLQALESLKVTKDKYAAMLLPMVESAVPSDVLKAWERSKHDKNGGQDLLTDLLGFLKREVESEERIMASRDSFEDLGAASSGMVHTRESTAACILTHEEENKKKEGEKSCVWCGKTMHSSLECYKPSRMSIDERRDVLKKKNCCFICLKVGHSSKRCRNFPKCLICGKRHVVLLCPSLENQKGNKDVNTLLCARGVTTVLQTVLVTVMYGGKNIVTRALFDSGSQRSYVRQDIASQLGMRPSNLENVSQCLFGGIQSRSNVYSNYKFTIQSLDGKFQLDITALGQKRISGLLPRLSSVNAEVLQKLSSLSIKISDVGDEPTDVGLLIGADISGYLLTGDVVNIGGNLVAIGTRLGWCLQGSLLTNTYAMTHTYVTNFSMTDLWDLKTLGIRDPAETKSVDVRINEVVQFFRDTVDRGDDGRYSVCLPWKEGFPVMLTESNEALSYKRLQSTTKRLGAIGYLDQYNSVFKDWEAEGVIERVATDEGGFYLPHHAVIRLSSSSTPVRPVFDASAKNVHGVSLNSCLEKGTNFIESIPKLLIYFRLGSIGLISDIRRAFLQISIAQKDRNYLKFLWWDNVQDCKSLVTFRHRRVVFGVTCSPFLLAATINHHLDSVTDERKYIAQRLKSSFYVDNCVHSVDSEAERNEFVEVASKLMREAQFDLRGWVYGPCQIESTQSVLGLMWNNKEDFLFIVPDSISADGKAVTKRVLLSVAQQIFDPIGYTSPSTIIPKILLQKCWTLKLDWDDKLPDEIVSEFSTWFRQLPVLSQIHIPRRLTNFPIKECQVSIHTFCDACKYSYAACVFLRSEYDGQVCVRLINAKSRVAPVKEITIPRLELIASVIGVRLYREAVNALEFSNFDSYFWTDSSVALAWIKRDNKWPVFVRNRVKEIRSHSDRSQWYHIAGVDNPADLPSRGCFPEKLMTSTWWTGPKWLYSNPACWPKSDVTLEEKGSILEGNVNTVHIVDNECFSDNFLYFSKYSKIVRCVGWLLRFFHNCRFRNKVCCARELSYDEYVAAEKVLLRLIQSEHYASSDTPASGLETVVLEDGLIHVKTRLLLGDQSNSFKYPILIPGNHTIIQRLIYQKHFSLQHAGVTIVISKLREFYWLTRARRSVRKVISTCSICKRFTSKPGQAPEAPLPENRINMGKVFEVIGVDLAGPLYLKTGQKCWVVLFTCAVFRAVHLELTMSLSTDCFLMAFRRFISRRGRVRVVYSDNGTNFVGANNLFKNLNWDYIRGQLNLEKIEWRFNVPSAPWWGGFWERLIRCLKDLLRRVLGRASLSYVELETVLYDCEATLNSRPLTYISDNDSLSPLTPMHFLHDLPSNAVHDFDKIDSNNLNLRLNYLQNLRSNLRERFRKEYLGLLIHRRTGSRSNTVLKEGDIVLVESEGKRQFWPIGKIVKMIQGADKVSRAAIVRTSSGSITRPIQKLYSLELSRADDYVTRFGRIVRAPERGNVS